MMTLTSWAMIFTALALLSLILTIVFVLLSYLKLKSCTAEITTSITKTKKSLEGLILAPAIILSFGIGYMLFRKTVNSSRAIMPAHISSSSHHPWLASIAKELAFLGASKWLSGLSKNKQPNNN